MCDRNAVSSEHVPPKNLFPEQKDVGKDYRQYLITVPSCEIHNNHKSKDDEFLIGKTIPQTLVVKESPPRGLYSIEFITT